MESSSSKNGIRHNHSLKLKKELSVTDLYHARLIYLFLASLFIASLVTCNIIANKFVTVDLGFKVFTISVGILPYPITFLITDILSEIYGRKRTNHVVYAGFSVSIFVLIILWLGHSFQAIPSSPVQDDVYDIVFKNSWRVILASMIAYLTAQLIDIRIFHFWKRVTKGKFLWVRNNFSTISSQLVDTTLVVFVLFAGTLSFDQMTHFIWDGWLFKALIALLDTFLIYGAIHYFKRRFNLRPGEEIEI